MKPKKKPHEVQDDSGSETNRLDQLDRVWTSGSDSGTDTDPSSCSDSEDGARPGEDSEGESLRKRIEYHKSQGRAKSRRSAWSSSLVARQVEIWREYVSHLLPTL